MKTKNDSFYLLIYYPLLFSHTCLAVYMLGLPNSDVSLPSPHSADHLRKYKM